MAQPPFGARLLSYEKNRPVTCKLHTARPDHHQTKLSNTSLLQDLNSNKLKHKAQTSEAYTEQD